MREPPQELLDALLRGEEVRCQGHFDSWILGVPCAYEFIASGICGAAKYSPIHDIGSLPPQPLPMPHPYQPLAAPIARFYCPSCRRRAAASAPFKAPASCVAG